MHQSRHDADSYQRVEVITGRRKRRDWSDEEKARILAESADPDVNVSAVARRNGVSRGLLNVWRRQARQSSSEGLRFAQIELQDEGAQPCVSVQPQALAGPAERIEVIIGCATVRVPMGADERTLAHIFAALGLGQ